MAAPPGTGINFSASMSRSTSGIQVVAVLFPEFELLDLYGPLEMFGLLEKCGQSVKIVCAAAQAGRVVSGTAGVGGYADSTLARPIPCDIMMVPGGMGTRAAVNDDTLLAQIRAQAEHSRWITSVCTGSALLAKAGLLDGKKATSNKRAFDWVAAQGPAVDWVRQARWVEDGNVFTSSGISAGIDMSLGLIDRIFGQAMAQAIASRAEYTWHNDAESDPFAAR